MSPNPTATDPVRTFKITISLPQSGHSTFAVSPVLATAAAVCTH